MEPAPVSAPDWPKALIESKQMRIKAATKPLLGFLIYVVFSCAIFEIPSYALLLGSNFLSERLSVGRQLSKERFPLLLNWLGQLRIGKLFG